MTSQLFANLFVGTFPTNKKTITILDRYNGISAVSASDIA